jgi:hypothetical protein
MSLGDSMCLEDKNYPLDGSTSIIIWIIMIFPIEISIVVILRASSHMVDQWGLKEELIWNEDKMKKDH